MRRLATAAAVAAIFLLPAAAASAKGPAPAIRVGGPSAADESKVAIVGSNKSLRRRIFRVVDEAGAVVMRSKLRQAPGKPDPWVHAYRADLSEVTAPGSYRIEVGRLRSRPWQLTVDGSRSALLAILGFFQANRDGSEPSPTHRPSHLHDAVIHPDAPSHGGETIDMTGGWMDAGDTLHFTQTTAYTAALLQAAARLDPADAAALNAEADVGVRWLVKAHPFPDVFIAQVGDERDHNAGFRDPATDDASTKPGIGTRFAYPEIGGDLGGRAATALAMAFQRTGDPALLAQAKDWYAAGKATDRAARPLKQAGYPRSAGNFYVNRSWEDSLAAGAAALYRATCAAGACDGSYLVDFKSFIGSGQAVAASSDLGVYDAFASFAGADACGTFGDPPLPEDAGFRGCQRLVAGARTAVRRAAKTAFGMPGYFSWGTTATNGGSGALAALATAAPRGPDSGCAVAAGARDYLLGRNPFGRSFVVGYGPRAARHPHHWGSVFGPAIPTGAVVGGPAPVEQISDEGFSVRGPLNSRFAAYADKRPNYVTSEPALDYAANSVLLLAALAGRC